MTVYICQICQNKTEYKGQFYYVNYNTINLTKKGKSKERCSYPHLLIRFSSLKIRVFHKKA